MEKKTRNKLFALAFILVGLGVVAWIGISIANTPKESNKTGPNTSGLIVKIDEKVNPDNTQFIPYRLSFDASDRSHEILVYYTPSSGISMYRISLDSTGVATRMNVTSATCSNGTAHIFWGTVLSTPNYSGVIAYWNGNWYSLVYLTTTIQLIVAKLATGSLGPF